MSKSIPFTQGKPCDEYTIRILHGCKIVTGTVPVEDFVGLAAGFSSRAIMAVDIAHRIGAVFVIGEPEDIEALRQMDLPISEARQLEAGAAEKQELPAAVVEWLKNGERGASSEAMCKAMFGGPWNVAKTAYPLDPSDLSRCLKFMDIVDDSDYWRMVKLKDVSVEWSSLINHWDELKTCFYAEGQNNKPKTYELMNEILNDSRNEPSL